MSLAKEHEVGIGTDGLLNLANAISAESTEKENGEHFPNLEQPQFVPPIPETIGKAGLTDSAVEQLILKHLHFRDEMVGRDLSDALGLRFSLIEKTIESLKRQHLVQ